MAVLNRRLPLQLVAKVAGVAEPRRHLKPCSTRGCRRGRRLRSGHQSNTPIPSTVPPFMTNCLQHCAEISTSRAASLEPEEALVHRVAACDPEDHELIGDLVTQAETKGGQRDLGLSAKYWLWSSNLSQVQRISRACLLQGAQCLLADGQVHRAQALQDRDRSDQGRLR